jgi:FlaA1/EpsC-like NDP-sugar epimerase
MRQEGLLDSSIIGPTDWEILLSIMENPEEYYKKEIIQKKELYEKLRNKKEIILYGAGMIGRRVLQDLTYNENPLKILCFAVSEKDTNVNQFQGFPIGEIQELTEYRKTATVIVTTTKIHQDAIVAKLQNLILKTL